MTAAEWLDVENNGDGANATRIVRYALKKALPALFCDNCNQANVNIN
jgi:hypothetical protein